MFAKTVSCQSDAVSNRCRDNTMSCEDGVMSARRHFKKKTVSCQHYIVCKKRLTLDKKQRTASKMLSCQHAVVPTRHRVNTTACRNEAVPTRCRTKTTSCKHDVVSKRCLFKNGVAPTRRRVNVTPCRDDTLSIRRRAKTVSCQARRRVSTM